MKFYNYIIERKNVAFTLALFFGFFCLIIFSSAFLLLFSKEVKKPAVAVASPTPPVIIPEYNPFADILIEARAAYVLDVSTGKVLYKKNEEAQLPLASVTKVMTALVSSRMPEDTVITIKSSDLQSGNGGLSLSEKWHLKDLINYTLLVSSNSGANAIAGAMGSLMENGNASQGERNESLFIDQMNQEARALHLDQTFYLNPSGLDVNIPGNLSGAYGSARDMANLFSYIIANKPSLLEATAYDSRQIVSMSGISHLAANTNTVTRYIPGLIASKTGYTDLADGNLVVAFDIDSAHTVVIAVLGSSQSGRFSDVEKLAKASIKKLGKGMEN